MYEVSRVKLPSPSFGYYDRWELNRKQEVTHRNSRARTLDTSILFHACLMYTSFIALLKPKSCVISSEAQYVAPDMLKGSKRDLVTPTKWWVDDDAGTKDFTWAWQTVIECIRDSVLGGYRDGLPDM